MFYQLGPCRFLEKHYANVEALLHLDPLTLQAFVFVCPDEYLAELFCRIPPNVCIAWLSFLMTNLGYTVNTHSEVSIMVTVVKYIHVFQSNFLVLFV